VKNGPALAGHGAEAVRDAIAAGITTLPQQLRRSLTWDQGTEMAQHTQLRIQTGLPVYFCDPHSPWQRGTNENTNGLLRQYFPKGTDLARHSRRIWPRSLPRSTAVLARRSDGELRPRPSTSSCSRPPTSRSSASDIFLSDPQRVTLPQRPQPSHTSQLMTWQVNTD
jgi:hypothetical protein